VTLLFVYGTLVPDGGAWRRLERWIVGDAVTDAVPGALYDTTRGYPGACFPDDAAGVVHGVVVTLDEARVEAALAALDRYEGAEYRRVTVRTVGGLEAFTYAWIAPLAGCVVIGSGRWPVS
jgi:gamma-glutamylcyclotransferase (GGCT)/AIG2-like uncharacterized protein YtfP